MNAKDTLDLTLSLLLLLGGLYLIHIAGNIRSPAGAFPIGVFALIVALAALNLVKIVRRPRRPSAVQARPVASIPTEERPNWTSVVLLTSALAVYTALLPLGFVPVTFVMLSLLYLFFSRPLNKQAIAGHLLLALLLSTGAFIAFRQYLGVNLAPTGWFGVL